MDSDNSPATQEATSGTQATQAVTAPAPVAPQAPTAPKAPVKMPTNFQPVAWDLTTKLRSTARQAVLDFKPAAAHKSEVLAAAKSAAVTLIDSFAEDVNGIGVKIEVGGASAHHLLVIVYPHRL